MSHDSPDRIGAGILRPDQPFSTPEELIHGDGKRRVVVERVSPEVNAGRYPIKRVPGERVAVDAEVFADGHDLLSVRLKYQHESDAGWSEVRMEHAENDHWLGEFVVTKLGVYRYTVESWVDHFKTWRRDLGKRLAAQQDVSVDLLIGAELVREAAGRAAGEDAERLAAWARNFSEGDPDSLDRRAQQALDGEMNERVEAHPDRAHSTVYSRELRVAVDPVLARTGAWYELFPRSCPGKKEAHGTFRDVEAYLPRIAEMGFDVLYLPPIHPIGRAFRKGRNNAPAAEPDEPGSPWAIGSEEGGHTAIHPQLGTLDDFKRLVVRARELNIEIALDLAWQCSPDHPWVREHPAWFKARPDGTIQYAENPPKKYQDIYPIDFESDDWQALWRELKDVIEFWLAAGVRVFRVDNPHTKAFPYWEWALGEIRRARPDTIFLAEAFTRPHVMYALSKLGFNQSYNYFPWRNDKAGLTEYLTELSQTELREYFRANLWPNTPDILTEYLQEGGRAAFQVRLVLAATLGSSYGIYGPAFELMENQPLRKGSEEYLNSEKYQIRDWDVDRPESLSALVTSINRIRREHPALHALDYLDFHWTDNPQIIAYSKTTDDWADVILVIANVDPHNPQSGWVDLALEKLALPPLEAFTVEDLLTGERFVWHGSRNFVVLDPHTRVPAHLFRIIPPARKSTPTS